MADLNPEDFFLQIRTAHRMVVAYYKRLFPKIQGIADRLNMNFYYWSPSDFNRPGLGSTNILLGKKWEWDLIPGGIANYLFVNTKETNKQKFGDWMLDFYVITDTGISSENRKSNQDPLSLSVPVEKAKSVLRIYIWVAAKKNSLNWYRDIWESCDYPDITDEPSVTTLDEDYLIYGSGFEIPLSDLIMDDAVEKVACKVEEYREYILKSIKDNMEKT